MGSPCYAAEFNLFEEKRIGVFGGSFDPVHEGHIHLARLAKEALDLEEVWFMPCQISPHKTDTPPTPGEIRAEWLRLALKDIPWARVDMTELEAEGVSYSYKTLQALDAKHRGIRWYWIMGGDQWEALPRWAHPEKIAELADFIVLARNGSKILPREGYALHVVEGEHPASATEIRQALARGESGIPYLDPAIAKAISEKSP